MSVIEDSRKLVQDFLAPELRSISARLDALEKKVDGVDRKIDEVDRRAEKRGDEFFRHFERRHDEVMAAIANSSEVSALRERMARLESRDNPPH